MSTVAEPRPARVDLKSAETASVAMLTFWRMADARKLMIAERLALLGVVRIGPPANDQVRVLRWLGANRMLVGVEDVGRQEPALTLSSLAASSLAVVVHRQQPLAQAGV